jgi:amidohydrolase
VTTTVEARALDAVAEDAVRWRRHLHRHPELSFQEHETARFVRETLESFGGLEVSSPTLTSVVARLRGGRPGKTLALRADIDALPILEESGVEFSSSADGVMHACGHDGHTAMLLAVASLLSGRADELAGEIRFLFQHAEELPPGGARDLVAAGVLEGVDAVVGCHLFSTLELGKVAVLDGAAMAAADMFSLTVRGRGGHGAFPHETVDPVAVSAQVVTNLQHVVSRNTRPLDSVVVSVTRVAGGTADNVIPETVELGGTVRMFSDELRARTRESMERILQGVTQAHGASYELDYTVGYDPVVNDPALAARVREVVGPEQLTRLDPIMGGDDFSAYQRVVPGVYFFVGAGGKGAFPHHHARFAIDEAAFPIGIDALSRTALAFLG